MGRYSSDRYTTSGNTSRDSPSYQYHVSEQPSPSSSSSSVGCFYGDSDPHFEEEIAEMLAEDADDERQSECESSEDDSDDKADKNERTDTYCFTTEEGNRESTKITGKSGDEMEESYPSLEEIVAAVGDSPQMIFDQDDKDVIDVHIFEDEKEEEERIL